MNADDRLNSLSRRTFLKGAGLAGATGLVLHRHAEAADNEPPLPQRVLGRTKQQVTALALGTWPCGRSSDVSVPGVVRLVHEALDLGINYIDTARSYGKAERAIGIALEKRRDEVFLTSKVWADTEKEAATSFETSLRDLRTDRVDLVFVHGVGNRDVEKVMASNGSLAYLLRQKEKGVIRFIGLSGHSRPQHFIPLIKTGQIDVVMMPLNFVDRFTYGFEKEVLPVAQEFGLGIACMKTFGGMKGGFSVADGSNPGPMVPQEKLAHAARYALGVPGVAALVIGPHTVGQLRENVKWVSRYQPLSDEERQSLLAIGKQLAPQWGPHYGPIA